MSWKPDAMLGSVLDITPEWMERRGLRGLLLDLDNTLAPYHADKPPDNICAWIKDMTGRGFLLMVCSNAKHSRVETFCRPLGLKYIHKAGKPKADKLLRALTTLGLKTSQTAMVGDQLFTDVWSGQRSGVFTVLVDPLDNTFVFRVRRRIEQMFIK